MKKKTIEPLQKKAALDLEKTAIDLRKSINRFIKDANKLLLGMHIKIDGFDKSMKKVIKTNEVVDETMCNVLLAIKQNEYLHAWYPPQQGQPEQKVAGLYTYISPERKVKSASD